MEVLKYCGIEAKETYTVLKAISKKKESVIKSVESKMKNGMFEKLKNKYDNKLLTKIIDELWQVILDSSNYSFNVSHSYCMAHDSVWVAYAKAHYPNQTYVALIKYFTNKRDMVKVRMLKHEAQLYFGIHIADRKIGQDNRKLNVVNGTIYQSLASIKGINEEIGEKLYNINSEGMSSLELYLAMKEQGLTKTHIENLAKINYFNNSLEMLWLANNYKAVKQLSKKKIIDLFDQYKFDCELDILSMELYYEATAKTEKQLKFDDVNSYIKVLLKHIIIDEPSILERYYWEMDLIGDVISNQGDYLFYKIEKYNEKKGSILLNHTFTNQLTWFIYKKNLKIRSGEIVCLNKKSVEEIGKIKKINQMFNLTQMFG